MADEISIQLNFELKNGDFKAARNVSRATFDQTTAGAQAGLQDIGTSWEAIALGNVTTEGYAYFRNLDDTNFVQIGPTGTAVIKLLPGQMCLFPVDPSLTVFAQADTAACNLDVLILEA